MNKQNIKKKEVVASTNTSKLGKDVLLKVTDIEKKYGKHKVLKGINFEIKSGERVALIGANGAGKSTLSEIISLIRTPSSGTIEYKYGSDEREVRKNMGIQFQTSNFPHGFIVKDLISFYLDINKIKMTQDELVELFRKFHFLGFRRKSISSLSGGQQQRLNILLAMINSPEFLVLDEVSTGLDIEAKADIHAFISDYLDKNKSTLLLVSHSASEIDLFCDRVIAIDGGLVTEDIQVKDIHKKYKTTALFLDSFFAKRRKEIAKEQEARYLEEKKTKIGRGK
jgi:ABC-2 type transport system ATP-binding protein